jgi:DUF438 domain-containing protein
LNAIFAYKSVTEITTVQGQEPSAHPLHVFRFRANFSIARKSAENLLNTSGVSQIRYAPVDNQTGDYVGVSAEQAHATLKLEAGNCGVWVRLYG